MKKQIHSLLKTRAAALAKEPATIDENIVVTEFIEVTMGDENYAIESAFVKEVCPLKDFTRIPGVAAFIHGIVCVRGSIIPIVNLKKFFNIPEKGLGELNKLIIVYDEQMEFAILVDTIVGTRVIKENEMLPVPRTINGIGEEYVKGVLKDRLILLNTQQLLRDKRIIVDDRV